MTDGLLKTGAQEGNETQAQGNGDATQDKSEGGSQEGTLSADNWKDFIPEELKDRAEWGRVNSISDVFSNYIKQGQTISKSVRIPDESSTTEQINAFYQKLGKPVDKSGYTFEYTKANDKYIYDKDSFDFGVFQDLADSANLSVQQYQALASKYIDIQNENALKAQEEFDIRASKELRDAEAVLRDKWGNQYNNNINAITTRIEKSYPKETLEKMAYAGLFRDPAFLERQLALTKMQTGDTLVIDGNIVSDVPQTLEALTQQRDELMQQDYAKNYAQVQELNRKIVQLKVARRGQVSKAVLS